MITPFNPIRPYYRDQFDKLIPQHPSMVLNERGDCLQVDWRFLDAIYKATPDEHKLDFLCRQERINEQFGRMLPRPTELSGYLGTSSPIAERLINSFLVRYDLDRKAARLATFSDMIRHELGIEACYLSFDALT